MIPEIFWAIDTAKHFYMYIYKYMLVFIVYDAIVQSAKNVFFSKEKLIENANILK